jgi:uncharacterized protein YndB with AHSA1/START domain
MITIPNTIERSVIINADPARVYSAITDPQQFGTWFSNGVEGDFNPGSQPVIDEGQYGKFRLSIIDARPNEYFSYRWVSGTAFVPHGFTGDPLQHPNTLVEFFIEEVQEGTRVRVVETGFASLPEAYALANHTDNTDGWEYQLEALRKYIEGV